MSIDKYRTGVSRLLGCAEERGTTALELALILPVLLAIILGTIDFGLAVFAYNMTGEAARDGARRAQVLVTRAEAQQAAAATLAQESALTPYVDGARLSQITAATLAKVVALGAGYQTTTTAGGDAAQGYYVRVAVTTDYRPVTGGLIPIGTIHLAASSRLYLQ